MSKLTGMTGFARVSGANDQMSWLLEARSVNGKGLDVRLRLPPRFASLETDIRKLMASTFNRGNIQVSVSYEALNPDASYQINETLIDQLSAFSNSRDRDLDLGQILQVHGVVKEVARDISEEDYASLSTDIMADISTLVSDLKTSRDIEGTALAPILLSAIERIETLSDDANKISATLPRSIHDKLMERVKALNTDVDEGRLAQEVAYLALKADVREELDRLKAHCDQAKALLEQGSPVGRELDFLCQEFKREANTLCSKSSDIELTRTGLDLKNTIEQFREQVANVE